MTNTTKNRRHYCGLVLLLSLPGVGCSSSSGPQGVPDATPTQFDATPAQDSMVEKEQLWDRYDVLNLTLEGAFQEAFRAAHAGSPDGSFPPVRVKENFAGTLEYSLGGTDVLLDVTLRVRGNTSLLECQFPKLRMKVPLDEARLDSLFHKVKRSKIGTHCADRLDDAQGLYGRVLNEKGPPRESLLFALMADLHMPSQKVRPAKIRYIDTSVEGGGIGWDKTRNAFLFDNIRNVAKRLDAMVWDEEQPFPRPEEGFGVDREQSIRVYFFQALIGNWDWRFSLSAPTSGLRPWNTHVLILPDSSWLPIAYDFDLASMVTMKLVQERDIPDDLYPEKEILFRQAAHYLQKTKVFTEQERQDTALFFRSAKEQLLLRVDSWDMDEVGRENAKGHLRAFYEVLDAEYPAGV